MDDILVKINDADKIEIDVDKNDVDKIFTFDDIDDKNDVDKIFTFDNIGNEPHNGKPITKIEISPKENYLITYSKEDSSIAGWNVEDMDKIQLKFDQTVKIDEDRIHSLYVSDDKKLAYINFKCYVIDMNNKDKKKIAINLNAIYADSCTFNLKGEFILYSTIWPHSDFERNKIIWIYSTQTKNNKWECKRFYRIPEDYELISISKYDNVYLVSNKCIYEWNINTEKSVKIFGNNKDKNKFETENIGIFSNEKFIFLKINDKIIIYSIELRITISSLDIDNDIQLYNFMNHTGLFLLPLIFYYTPDKGIWNSIKYCWNNKYKNMFNLTIFDEPTDEQTKVVFGMLNGRVWKSRLMSKTNFSSENSDELNKENNKIIECNDDDREKYMEIPQKIFPKFFLPLPHYGMVQFDKWVSDAKNNKLSLLKYGVELLTIAIKEHKLELIDDIYKKCMTYFKEDLMHNKSFLSIITSTMPLLDKYYPEYILRYSPETNMIIDSSSYSIEHQNKNLHLCSFFQYPQIANLSQSLLWTKYHYKFYSDYHEDDEYRDLLYYIINVIQALIILLTLPLYFVTFYILSKYNFINNIYIRDVFSVVYFYAELFIFEILEKIIVGF
ncbi:uncharacterized protein OCT59_019135 [Rhizophagus irregularis]|uniref:uncharacterized protein n=1 Tax=Rhizophagus irregularis TaxID=588596 RepID=UPI00331B5FD5|nr:hypothetical protein OCT59_019135 [Rhizophagus irregularis]